MENTRTADVAADQVLKIVRDACAIRGELKFISSVHLNNRFDTPVFRVTVAGGDGKEFTVISKQQNASYAALDFIPEAANYVFLQSHRERFDLVPKLLGRENEIFILEDLGTDQFVFGSREEILCALAGTFAKLHTAFAGMEKEYDAVRASFVLTETQDELRRNSEDGRLKAAGKGISALCDYAELMRVCHKETLRSGLQECLDVIFDKQSPLRTFVHDDVADRRQTVVKNGEVYLLDFEHGKYHHALMDLAKLLIGKVEYSGLHRGMFYNHPNMPVGIIGYYRRKRTELGATEFAEAFWEHHLTAALVVQMLLLVGRMLEMSGDQFLNPLATILRDVIRRLRFQLQGNNSHPELLHLLGQIELRIWV